MLVARSALVLVGAGPETKLTRLLPCAPWFAGSHLELHRRHLPPRHEHLDFGALAGGRTAGGRGREAWKCRGIYL